MIHARQIKAARALLGWSQKNLAKAAGLHLNAVHKIESELGTPRVLTLQRIQNAFELAGVRFRGQHGVELKHDVFETAKFSGKDFLARLNADLFLSLKSSADEIYCCTPDEALFSQASKREVDMYYKHMRKTGFKERVLTNRDNKVFLNADRKSYRWLSKSLMGKITYAVYQDRVVFINWDAQEALIVRSKSLACAFKVQFEFLWGQAYPFA